MTHLPLALLLAATAVIPVAQPTSLTPPGAPADERIATALDIAERMTVPTSINGQGPFAFTIDTAADRSVVSDRLARALGLPAAHNVTLHGIVGPEQVATVHVDRLKVGSSERRRFAAPVLPEEALGATGFIGIDALANRSVVLDFKRRRITLAYAQDAADQDPETVVVTGRSRFGQLILTDARIGKTKIYAIIDTGAQNTIGNMALHRLMRGHAPFKPGGATLIGVTGDTLPAEYGVVPRIKLGGLTLGNMPIAYCNVKTFAKFGVDDVPAILLGMDVLKGFQRVAVDFKRREVRFLVGDGPLSRS